MVTSTAPPETGREDGFTAQERITSIVERSRRQRVRYFGDEVYIAPSSTADDNGGAGHDLDDGAEARLLKLRAKFNAGFRVANDHVRVLMQIEQEKKKTQPKVGAAAGDSAEPRAEQPPAKRVRAGGGKSAAAERAEQSVQVEHDVIDERTAWQIEKAPAVPSARADGGEDAASALVVSGATSQEKALLVAARENAMKDTSQSSALANTLAIAKDRPLWHAPWRMYRVLMGHLGWVRCVAVDPSNEWFCTGAADRTVKIWDLASGKLRLTLTGHIGTIRGLAVSDRHPYMFSAGDDKQVKCWDLEYNKVIRHYHGHLSGVYCCALHPSLDVLVTGGRDATVRVWDMRTKAQIFALGGHRDAVNSVFTQKVDPQIVSGSADSMIRLWDLAAGKTLSTLTNHKKGVRAVAVNPTEFSFASASADNIKTWRMPNGDFMRNLSGHSVIINSLAVNEDGVLVSGGDDGSIGFWDYASAHEFQRQQTLVQPGSLDCEAGIFASAFDITGSRLITCEADKTVKMWKEDEKATPESHPLQWKPNLLPKRY